jgi:hypothetical protein
MTKPITLGTDSYNEDEAGKSSTAQEALIPGPC